MRVLASPAIGLKERRLTFLQGGPKATATDWKEDWMAQHGRESVPEKLQAEAMGGGQLNHLGGITRTAESTVGAVGNVLKGTGRFVFKGEFVKGAAQVGQGVFDAIDVIPSAAADGIRMVAGPDGPRGRSPYNYNITRALGSFEQIDMKRPVGAVGAVADLTHAAIFKPGSDILRAVQQN